MKVVCVVRCEVFDECVGVGVGVRIFFSIKKSKHKEEGEQFTIIRQSQQMKRILIIFYTLVWIVVSVSNTD